MRTIGYGTVSLTLGPLTHDRAASVWAMKSWCRSSAIALDIDVQATGLSNAPEGAFVYCSNHQSLLDVLVLGSVLPGDFKWAAKRSLWKVPFLGWHLRLAGHVPVERQAGKRAAAVAVAQFQEVLQRGKPLLVFPEGTRSEDGVLKSFKSGGFHAAVRANVPVVPVALDGTHVLMKKGAFDSGDGSMRLARVKIGAPIYPAQTGSDHARMEDLRDRTRAAIAALLTSIGGNAGDVAQEVAEVADVPPSVRIAS